MRALLNSALFGLVYWIFRPFNGLIRYRTGPQPLREGLTPKKITYILCL